MDSLIPAEGEVVHYVTGMDYFWTRNGFAVRPKDGRWQLLCRSGRRQRHSVIRASDGMNAVVTDRL